METLWKKCSFYIFRPSISSGSILSPNGRYELQLDKMSTEGFFIYDHELDQIKHSFTEDLFVSLELRDQNSVFGIRVRFSFLDAF